MDLLEDPTFKTKYQKSKLRVKLWESDFMEKYGRKPNKNDIKEADVVIRDAYKMYWKLKTRALEETLMDITFSDEAQANVSTDLPSSDSTTEDKAPPHDANDVENRRPDIPSPKKETVFEAVAEADGVNADGVWGDHLNKEKKAPVVKKKPLLVGRSSSFQLSQEKFKSTNFTKRNPRKSLSLVRAKSKSELDAGSAAATQAKDGFDPSEIMSPMFGESKAKVIQGESRPASKSVSAVHQLIDGKGIDVNRKIDAGWLERCSGQNNLDPSSQNPQRLSRTSDSGIESLESSIYSPNNGNSLPTSQTAPSISDEEDFICNSDSEGERRNKRVRNIKGIRGGESHAAKRQRLENSFAIQTCLQASQEYLTKSKPRIVENNSEDTKETKILEKPEAISHGRDVQTQKIEEGSKNSNSGPEASASEELIEKVSKPGRTRRKVYRKIKGDETDASDSENEKEKKTKEKVPAKPKKTRVTRATTKKQSTKSSNKIAESQPVDEKVQTEAPAPPIYGVETVDAVPRFAFPKLGSGDLIADFSRAMSKTDSKEIPAASTGGKKKTLTDKERLEQKVASGNINENFVRINLKKKVFVRGKKTMTFQKYKKNQWKQKKKELASGGGGLDLADLVEKKGVLTCFKCGDIGHFSRECKALKSDDLLPLIGDEEASEYPTLDEAAKMASETVLDAHRNRLSLIPQTASQSLYAPALEEEENIENVPSSSTNAVAATQSNDENFDDVLQDLDFAEDMQYEDSETPTSSGHEVPKNLLAQLLRPEAGPVEPLYPIGSNGELSVAPAEVLETLKKFGHESFRPGQEKAVMRILSGQSTLVTLSTGSGKSLCYQLPAYLYARHSPCITLVISPLVSLMDDQVTGVPKFLSAACLHTAQGTKQRAKVMDKVKTGTLDILLVSPEAVVAGEKSTGFGALLRQLPPIAFACIDEAHCISQWSHNFRPSYLMVCKVLREKLGVKTVLGLTATATKSTAESIVGHLSIPDGMAGVISDTPLPRNLTLTVSRDEHRDRALITLLESERFKDLDSIIVYCTRRDECVRLAGLLRMSLLDTKKHSKVDEKVSSVAEAYHAGLSAHRRKTVQNSFMSGETRIVVATVAFGMGINKSDIRAVIHYNMPSSFEGYVQEVGRAGRDGLPAHCHLFISPKEAGDKSELRRHIYANGVDRHMVRRLLQKVFVPCSCAKNTDKRCPGHEVAIAVDEIVRVLDIPQEIISTLLCYLELHPKKFITTLPSVYVNAKVTSYNGPNALKAAAQSSPPLAMAIALDLKRGISHEDSSVVEFPVVDVAAAIGWDSGVVKGHLKSLEWKNTENGAWKRTPISITFDTLGFRVRAPGDLSNTELDNALEVLTERASSQQRMSLCQLEAIHSALNEVALDSVRKCRELDEDVMEKSETLKTTIRAYFQTENPMGKIDLKLETELANETQIASDVRNLVSCYRDNNFTGRAVARIFHGIQSPNYPALVWSRCRLWRAHLSSNFDLICQIATREILAMR